MPHRHALRKGQVARPSDKCIRRWRRLIKRAGRPGFVEAGARGTWSYDLPDDALLAPLALRMLQGCADQIAEVCRLAGGQAERPSVGGAAGAVDKDDFDARVEALQKFFNRGKVGVVDGDGQSLADVGQKAKGVAAALGGDDGEGFRKDLYGEDLGAGAPDNVEQGGGLSVQLGEVGHGASPDGGLQGPSGEGESSAGAKRPATPSAPHAYAAVVSGLLVAVRVYGAGWSDADHLALQELCEAPYEMVGVAPGEEPRLTTLGFALDAALKAGDHGMLLRLVHAAKVLRDAVRVTGAS